jgi:peptidoglycan/xylan/chitin deacetylase (PgdA/CDA1 family)
MSLVRRAAAADAVYPVIRALRPGQRATAVLMYHTLGDDDACFDAWTVLRRADFIAQVEALRRTHHLVSLDDALSEGPGRRSKPLAVLTFDDGNASLHSHLLPIVERERLPVTIYVATGHLESRQPYWFDALMVAFQQPLAVPIDLRAHRLATYRLDQAPGPDRWLAISRVLEDLKTLDPAAREAAAADALAQAGTGPAPARAASANPLLPLTLDQLRDLGASRWVTIGSHTHGHELLDQIPTVQAVASIERSRDLLKAWTGRTIDHFAYPNGNHDDALVETVGRLGFRSAVTTQPALWDRSFRPHAIPRLGVGRYDGLDRLKLALLGL